MKDNILKDPLQDYLSMSIRREKSWISENMESYIPMSLSHSIALGKKIINDNKDHLVDDDLKEGLGKILEATTKKYKIFTEMASKHLDLYYNDGIGIEVAHQPKFMGGERFVFNKLALGSSLANLDEKFYPLFYLADYDKVHGELTKTHFSLVNSSSGFPCSINPEIEKKYFGTSIREIPLPSKIHLDESLQQIFDNYQFSINSCLNDAFHRKLLEERLEDALRLIKQGYYRSKTYNDWFINIAGTISNIFNDQGYLFIFSSDDGYRKLLTPVYEQILGEREKYLSLYVKLLSDFEKNGLNAPLRHVHDDFVPFFYECPEKKCNRMRIQLKAETAGSMVILQGKCENCGFDLEIITNARKPDLSEHSMHLTPRVETRQYLVAKTLQPAIHVSGTGETRYYTMSIPLLEKFDPNAI
ncbi:MAG: bacillithiol biosynthesis BshC, partial [Candidatus Hodarchaeota archaeon]